MCKYQTKHMLVVTIVLERSEGKQMYHLVARAYREILHRGY